jgi:hypothetical protein
MPLSYIQTHQLRQTQRIKEVKVQEQSPPQKPVYNDEDFLVEYEESDDEIIVELMHIIIGRVRANVSFNSNIGWSARDRKGTLWALIKANEPGKFILDLHGVHVIDRLGQIHDATPVPES